ncbi:unnamed protein product, partial [Polarella glacialis]
ALGMPQVASLVAPIPKAVLAAIVLAAVLPSVLRPNDVLKLRGSDAFVGWATALSSCLLDATRGFIVGLVLYFSLAALRRTGKRIAPDGKSD